MSKFALLVCVEDAGRCQMVDAFFHKYTRDKFSVAGARTVPTSAVNSTVTDAIADIGVDIKNKRPKTITQDTIKCTTVIGMRCRDQNACPALFLNEVIDQQMSDPRDKGLDEVRKIRDQTVAKELIHNLDKK